MVKTRRIKFKMGKKEKNHEAGTALANELIKKIEAADCAGVVIVVTKSSAHDRMTLATSFCSVHCDPNNPRTFGIGVPKGGKDVALERLSFSSGCVLQIVKMCNNVAGDGIAIREAINQVVNELGLLDKPENQTHDAPPGVQ